MQLIPSWLRRLHVCPGLVEVPKPQPGHFDMFHRVIATPMLGEVPDSHDTNIAGMTKDISMGRQGRAEEVAEGLIWLASGRASFVTATTLAVNGGKTGIMTMCIVTDR